MKISKKITLAVFKTIIILPLLGWGGVTLVSCSNKAQNAVPEGFRSEVMLRITPVKDQGKSELCWVYAMLATIETEHLMQEDSVNLSPDYVGRMYLEEQAMERFRSKGNQAISLRGMGPMTIDLIERYGVLPFDSYYPKNPVNYKVLQRRIEKAVDLALTHRYDEARCLADVRHLLDEEIGYQPRHVFMLGAQYTFLEFAHSVCMPKEYASYTSQSSAPLGKDIELPYKDNYYHCKAMNTSPDSLVIKLEESLRDGHPAMWEGGPNDNHAVCIIGMGKANDGLEYFVAKNSWGTNNPTRGLLYIQKEYVRDHTAVLVLKRED